MILSGVVTASAPNFTVVTGMTLAGTDSTYAYYYLDGSSNVGILNKAATVDYVMVGGGGGGGGAYWNNGAGGGGGGAGGVISGTGQIQPGSYSFICGSGGPAGRWYNSPDADTPGTPSYFTANGLGSLTALGGGYGSRSTSSNPNGAINAGSGGSGGGAGSHWNSPAQPGSGTSGQGNSGGTSNSTAFWNGSIWILPGGGGGGGKASAGSPASSIGGKGGDGIVPFSSDVVRQHYVNRVYLQNPDLAGVGGGGSGGGPTETYYSSPLTHVNRSGVVPKNIGGMWSGSWNGETYVPAQRAWGTGSGGFGNTFGAIDYTSHRSRTITGDSVYDQVSNGAGGVLWLRFLKSELGL